MSIAPEVILKWKKYCSYKSVRDDNECWSNGKAASYNGKGIYIMANRKGVPLYIGMAFGKWGFADRYNAWGFLDAAIELSGNSIFFTQLGPKTLCKVVETQLIWQESKQNNNIIKYNEKIAKPKKMIKILHEGEVPNFTF